MIILERKGGTDIFKRGGGGKNTVQLEVCRNIEEGEQQLAPSLGGKDHRGGGRWEGEDKNEAKLRSQQTRGKRNSRVIMVAGSVTWLHRLSPWGSVTTRCDKWENKRRRIR